MRRSKHSLSNYKLATFDMGQLVPVGLFEVLPGDSVRMSTSALLRLSPLMTPVMHPIQVRIHHWFVPNRILWEGWEDFITGGPDGEGTDDPFPSATFTPAAKSVGDYLGLPPGVAGDYNLMPIQGYNLIYNENYRDQDLINPVNLNDTAIKRCAWEKDYFTSARITPQKGPEVTLPFGTTAPVLGIGVGGPGNVAPFAPGDPAGYNESNAQSRVYTGAWPFDDTNYGFIAEHTGVPGYPGIYADLENASAVSVNEVRRAFAIQRYQEARSLYGSRYTEYLRYLGVKSSDARLQRPEYLGGGRATVSFSEVLKTGEGDTPDDGAPIGEMRGHGISAMRTRRFIRFFEEHGYVMTLASVRPRSMYSSGVNRTFIKRTKEDYWQKELEQIGQQEIFNREVYAAHASPDAVFGYNDRYAEYRHEPSTIAGEFRTTLNDWHLARIFGSQPGLNADFVNCDPGKRIFAEQTQNSLWGMFSHSIQARRLVGNKVIGRIF